MLVLLTGCEGGAAGPSPGPVVAPPAIRQHPQDQTVTVTATATFAVVATGTAPLTYAWTRNGIPISEATTASYTTRPTTHADNRARYAVRVSNAAGAVTSDAAVLTVTPSPLEAALSRRFAERFGEEVPYPAFFDNVACGGAHVAATAYLDPAQRRSTLLSLYTSPDGGTILTSASRSALVPAGTFRVLVLLVGYPQTVNLDNLALWAAAQQQVNGNHADFARARGWPAPIVTFVNTNVLLDASQVAVPRSPTGVATALAQQGYTTSEYDLVVSVNIDPRLTEGGYATFVTPGFIYMGNFSAWTAPLTAAQFGSVARAVYHHEVAHHWGWPGSHDWSTCGTPGFGFIVPPALFGWDDTNGDGTPEILSPEPYGRRRP